MTDINHVMLIGRLTKDLGDDERSFSYIASGQARANVSIAVNRSRKNGDQWVDEVSYFDVTIWGKTAENLKPYLLKGKQIAVEGYLKQDRWEKDGQKFSKVTITANNVQLLGGKDNGGNGSSYAGGAPAFQQRPQSSAPSFSGGYPSNDSFGGTGSDFPEDIPF
ncbi:MAG: single-stranded DNA-binding protein [Treponema sp.]|nr:single-stranded DNA-binding protein [Treponema sp.]